MPILPDHLLRLIVSPLERSSNSRGWHFPRQHSRKGRLRFATSIMVAAGPGGRRSGSAGLAPRRQLPPTPGRKRGLSASAGGSARSGGGRPVGHRTCPTAACGASGQRARSGRRWCALRPGADHRHLSRSASAASRRCGSTGSGGDRGHRAWPTAARGGQGPLAAAGWLAARQ